MGLYLCINITNTIKKESDLQKHSLDGKDFYLIKGFSYLFNSVNLASRSVQTLLSWPCAITQTISVGCVYWKDKLLKEKIKCVFTKYFIQLFLLIKIKSILTAKKVKKEQNHDIVCKLCLDFMFFFCLWLHTVECFKKKY